MAGAEAVPTATAGAGAAASTAQPGAGAGTSGGANGNANGTGSGSDSASTAASQDVAVFASQRETQPASQLGSAGDAGVGGATDAARAAAATDAESEAKAEATSATAGDAGDASGAGDAGGASAQASTQPDEERVTLTRKELEAEQERRVQAALAKSQRKWEREFKARQEREAAEAAQRAHEARLAELKRRSDAGEYEADEELLKLTKEQLATKFGQQALTEAEQRAQAAERARLWQQHLESFAVDVDDDEVAEAAQGAADFKALNAVLLRRSADPSVVEAAWANEQIQARHQAEVAKLQREHAAALALAREAASTSSGIAAMRSGVGRVDVSTSSGGRPTTVDEIERAYATPEGARDPEIQKLYRERVLTRRAVAA